MSKIYKNVTEFIGNTPLMEICHIEEKEKLKGRVLVKLEYLNPAGSVKDRAAKSMLEDAQRRGVLKAGSVIIEPTSGNTGIGLASIAAVLGYRMILTMPETMSQERINILKAYGAEIVLTDGKKGMQGAVDKAQNLPRFPEFHGSLLFPQKAKGNPQVLRRSLGFWNSCSLKILRYQSTCLQYLLQPQKSPRFLGCPPRSPAPWSPRELERSLDSQTVPV